MEPQRIGELLVRSGVLTQQQVQLLLEYQQKTSRPLGWLAERHFGIDPTVIEEAWAQQYAGFTRAIDPEFEIYADDAAQLVTRRQAWQFCVLPIRFDDGELLVATTQHHLRRALGFATNVIGVPVFFVLAEPLALGRALCKRYPLPGLTPESVEDDEALNNLLELAKRDRAA